MGPKKDQNIDKAKLKTRKSQYSDRGYCKHGDKCYNIHTDKVRDDKNCSGQCDKRHPNPCKFGARCTYYKKNVCSYSHVTFACDDKTIDALTQKCTKKFAVFEKQMVTLQSQVNNLKKTVGERDSKISLFEAKQIDNTRSKRW